MPPRAKISKEMVTDASVEIIRKYGHESLNVRAIAEYLNCSTQPVLYSSAPLSASMSRTVGYP